MTSPRFQSQHRWALACITLLAILQLVKLVLAAKLPLFGDEAFYWLESRYPAPAYSDLPPVTAMLVAAGTWLIGDTYLGVRLPFLILGAFLPLAVYRLARLLVGTFPALGAAGATACLPLAATLGLLALPDVPLTLFAVAGLYCLCRAVTGDGTRWWLMAGACAALGLATHYRFLVWLAGPVGWLLFSRAGRSTWRGAGPWLAAAVAAAGLAPIAWFNLAHDFSGLSFQFVQRHPWSFQPEGWRFALTQVLVATPLVFAALAHSAVLAGRDARADPRIALALWFALLPLAFFCMAAFFADAERTSAHWTLAGYLPLLAWLVAALGRWPRWLRWLVPVSGAAGTLAFLGWVSIAVWPGALGGLTGAKAFPHNFSGWREVAEQARRHRASMAGDGGILVGGNFMLAAELAFELQEPRVFALGHPLNRKHGRAKQLSIWRLDESSLLARRAGERAVVVLEDSARKIAGRPGWARRVCSRFRDVEYLGEQVLFGGRKRFLHFAGEVRNEPAAPPGDAIPTGECDLPPYAYLARPLGGAAVQGEMEVFGWAVEDNQGVESVTLMMDGQPFAALPIGGAWADVARFLPGSVDPRHPNVEFRGRVSLKGVSPGHHRVALSVVTRDGNRRVLENRWIRVVP